MDGPWFKFTPLRFAEVTVLMLMAAGSGWAQPNPATFRHPQRFPAGEQPWAAVVADFNHDGKPDAAVADKATGNVDILLNKGNGFSAPVSYATGTSATSIATADFNQDGNQDLAVVGETGFVYILIGSGNGTFQPATSIPLPWAAHDVITGDFNGDGKADLAVAAGDIFVFPGNGDGTFGAPVVSKGGPGAVRLAAGDFNGDGKLDLAIVTRFPYYYVEFNLLTALGNGDGSFTMKQQLITNTAVVHLVVADLNKDGNDDIVDGSLILFGNGDGTFQAPVYFPVEGAPQGIAVADVDGDGAMDILTANNSNSVSIVPGKGDCTFGASYSYAVDFAPHWIASANFLGHGANDLIVLGGSVALLPGMPKGRFQAQPVADINGSTSNAPVLADFNGDGNLDAAVAGTNSVQILLGKGNGRFFPPAPVSAGPSPNGLVTADFDGDGNFDIAVGDSQTHLIYILLGNGDGTFSLAGSYAVQGVCCYSIAATDLNNDGKVDLVVAGGAVNTGAVTAQALLGNGNGTFGSPLLISASWSSNSFAAGDFNGDGYIDLVASDGVVGPELFIGNGNGTFQNPILLYDRGPAQITAGDFNGDGNLDLAFFNPQSQMVVLLGNGNGTFQSGQVIPYVDTTGNLLAGDLNGDGHLDLLVGGDQKGILTIYLGNGDGTFTQQSTFVPCVTGISCGAAMGDLNGDGKTDILTTETNSLVPFLAVGALMNTTRQ